MGKKRIACVVGTRPDAIKSMPVLLELQRRSAEVEPILISTGQHREMLAQVFYTFGVQPTIDLELMKANQSLAELSSRALMGLDQAIQDLKPDVLLAQGDTTTTFIASLAAFYRQVPFGHIEAGLRTGDMYSPFPEEFNRCASALIARHHYAPTEWAANNLRHEHVPDDRIFVTGNTGIDAVKMVAEKTEQTWLPDWKGRVVLLTTHRRENWGDPQRAIARSVKAIVEKHGDIRVVVAMHRNPIVREVLTEVLGGMDRVDLIEPPEYESFVKLMQRSDLILTDSGGVQEEAPSFGIPVLVLRDTTERPEGVDAGCAKLIGTEEADVYREADLLLSDESARAKMAQVTSPYGDGQASAQIVDKVLELA